MTEHELDRVVKEVLRIISLHIAAPRMAIVTSYDPSRGIKARIMPEAADEIEGELVETGWIPISHAQTGSGWGIYAPPSPGDQIMLVHQEHDHGSAVVMGRINDDDHKAPEVPAGEVWVIHQKNGSLLKFTNDGNVTFGANTDLTINATDGAVTVNGKNVTVNAQQKATVSGNEVLVTSSNIQLGGEGGRRVARDGDPVIQSIIRATSTTTNSL